MAVTFIAIFALCNLVTFDVTSALTSLQVVWLVPYTSHPDANYVYNASTSVAALALGIETVERMGILPNHSINVTFIDTQCSSKESLGALFDFLLGQHVDVVLGPPCAEVVDPVGELLSYRNVPLLNWVSVGQTIEYKYELTTYFRTMAPISSLGGIMMLFYYYTGWRRLVIISSDRPEYRAAAETIKNSIEQHAVNGFYVSHHYNDITLNPSDDVIDTMLRNIIHEGRVIVLLTPREELRNFMLRAHAVGMTSGDYQFLYTDTQLADAIDVVYLNSNQLWYRGDSRDDKALQAFENVLYFVLGHTTQPTSTWRDSAMAAHRGVFGNRTDAPTAGEPDEYSAYLHDTMFYWASLLNTSLSNNASGSGADLFSISYTSYFKGLSGDVIMNQLGDRQPAFFVYDLAPSGNFSEVAALQYAIDATGIGYTVNSSFTKIIWGDGRTTDDPYIPPDSPVCGFFEEFCQPESESGRKYAGLPNYSVHCNKTTLTVVLSVSISMLVILLALFMIYRWYRGEQDLKNMSWKIKFNDLNLSPKTKTHSMTHLSTRLTNSAVSVANGSDTGTVRSGAVSGYSMARGQIFTTVADHKGQLVALKRSTRKKVPHDRNFLLQIKHLIAMKHGNVTSFVGVCPEPEFICSVWEYCCKGSIQDVIENDDIKLDTMFKLSIAVDVCQGLDYIHKSPIRHHGNLKSSNCVIDSRWVCKLTDFGIERLKPEADSSEEVIGEHAFYARLFWTAPEILRQILKKEKVEYTPKSDIYAVGIIVKELLCRNEPYCSECTLSPKEIIHMVAYPTTTEDPFRPEIGDISLDSEYRRSNMEYMIARCWDEDPETRPTMKAILRTLNKINPYKKANVVDNMMAMMEKYTTNLEDIVTERTEQLQEEKRKTDALLYRMLPKKVADDLMVGRSVQAEAFEAVTIYFSDIVQFTDLASESTPLEIVALLNALYTVFDDIISHFDVYKVETIGDAYMLVSGLPERNGNRHAQEIGGVALSILRSVLTFTVPHKPGRQLELRIGLHTGSVVAGVVGLTMPRYCLFGDTVNTASRMESNGKPLKIHISASTKGALDEFPKFIVEERGEITVKGKGSMTTYWLNGLDEEEEEEEDEDDVCSQSPDRNAKLNQVYDSDQEQEDTHEHTDQDNTINSGGKNSIADSGIGIDKAMDEKFGNVYLGIDAESIAREDEKETREQMQLFGRRKINFVDETDELSSNKHVYDSSDKDLRNNWSNENVVDYTVNSLYSEMTKGSSNIPPLGHNSNDQNSSIFHPPARADATNFMKSQHRWHNDYSD
ncbi:atrial natriuretic peptide receptor 1-like [Mya arenaria]|uniref:atrial natriuretic peptide receptor 1-like n=1 Tax=Mya arenaria TaxID=6604 RepID=UPI0022E0FF72|nr:atrial natriuretic peptide receptor 1-like [Mya arenaria]